MIVCARACSAGRWSGAVCGFALGFLLDSSLLADARRLLARPAGGRLPGRPLPRGIRSSRTAACRRCLLGVLTIASSAPLSRRSSSCSESTPRSACSSLREIFVQALLAFLLGDPALSAVRRILRPALIDDDPSPGAHALAPYAPEATGLGAASLAAASRGSGARPERHEARRPSQPSPRGGALMSSERERPLLPAQFPLRVAILSGFALVAVRDHLLSPLVPAGAVGRQVPDAGAEQPGARVHACRRRAARSSTATERPRRQPHRAGAAAAADRAAQAQVASASGVRAPGQRDSGMRPKQIEQAVRKQTKDAAGEPGDAAARRRLRHSSTTCGRTRPLSGGRRAARLRPPTTRRRHTGRAHLGYVGEVTRGPARRAASTRG